MPIVAIAPDSIELLRETLGDRLSVTQNAILHRRAYEAYLVEGRPTSST